MANKKKKTPKKEMSEGKTIALAVLLFTGAVVVLVYAVKLLIDYLI